MNLVGTRGQNRWTILMELLRSIGRNHGVLIDYRMAEPLYRDGQAFRLSINDDEVRFELRDHFQ